MRVHSRPNRGAAISGEDHERTAYLALTLGGVQEFIGAARRTVDLWTASRLVSHLSHTAARATGGRLVLPAGGTGNAFPNRILVALPPGGAAAAARSAAAAVHDEWQALARAVHGPRTDGLAASLSTFPDVRWVAWEPPSAEDGDAGFLDAWAALGEASAARKRVRAFPAFTGQGRQICSLCGQRDRCSPPGGLRRRRGEELCAVCIVKRGTAALSVRLDASVTRFPSTASLASAPFRKFVIASLALPDAAPLIAAVQSHLAAVDALHHVLPSLDVSTADGAYPALENCAGLAPEPARDWARDWARVDGAWCYAESWSADTVLREQDRAAADVDPDALAAACAQGGKAVARILGELKRLHRRDVLPATYLALLAQDADDLGTGISQGAARAHGDPATWVGEVSNALIDVAALQTEAIEDDELLGRVVYAGGDDLLALLPLDAALRAAGRGNEWFQDAIRPLIPGSTASSALLCFHVSFPLQDAVRRAREALHDAKELPGKDCLAVVVVRRGGERARTVLPWERRGRSAVDSLTGLVDAFRHGLSPALMNDMACERDGLAELAAVRGRHRTEVARLVKRHSTTDVLELVLAVEPLGGIAEPADIGTWVDTLHVARFLAQEAR